MKNRDKRTRLMSEILSTIRTIKFFAWENTFIRRVLEVRNNQELKMLRKIGVVTVFVYTTLYFRADCFVLSRRATWRYGQAYHCLSLSAHSLLLPSFLRSL